MNSTPPTDKTAIYRALHSTMEYALHSSTQRTYTKKDYILGHKYKSTNLNELKLVSSHKGIRKKDPRETKCLETKHHTFK